MIRRTVIVLAAIAMLGFILQLQGLLVFVALTITVLAVILAVLWIMLPPKEFKGAMRELWEKH